MAASSLAALAARQLADYRAGSPGTAFGGPLVLSLEDSYEVQLEVARLRQASGDEVAGYKVGCTGPTVRQQFGMDGPISGFLWRSEVLGSGATVAASRFDHLAIEGEVAVWIGPDGRPASLVPVIELHNYIFRSPKPTLQELVANNGIHAGVVLAKGNPMPWDPALDVQMRVFINDELREEGPLSAVPGGPSGSLAWLESHLKGLGLGLGLRPGHLVLTGAPLSLVRAYQGDVVHVTAGELGDVTVSVRP